MSKANAAKPPEESAVAQPEAPRTLTHYVEEINRIVDRAKRDGIGPITLLLGVAGRQGLSAWDVLLNTFDPGGKQAAGK